MVIAIIGILAAMLLPALARAKAKANRVKCVNNIGAVYKAGLGFAQDNGERHPWQLTNRGVKAHFGITKSDAGRPIGLEAQNGDSNLVVGTGETRTLRMIYVIDAMKVELVTPKILLSPCDGTREAANLKAQKNWEGYHIYNVDDGSKSPDADLKEMQKGTSYHLVRGADTQRPTSVYGATRNTTRTELDYHDTKWIGSDIGSDAHISVLIHSMSGLKNSQGQLVTSDGGARQSNDADLARTGTLRKAAKEATGGVATGRTSLAQMR